jgi:hypothetical protein
MDPQRRSAACAQTGQLSEVINPSLLVHQGFVYVVARRHAEQRQTRASTWEGKAVTEVTTVRHTNIVLRKLPLNVTGWRGWDPAGWGMNGALLDADVRASVSTDEPIKWPLCDPPPVYQV